jgi:hypothetical protein
VFARAAGQRCVAGWEEDKVIQVGAGQAQSALVFDQCDPGPAAEILAALVARRFAGRDEYLEIKLCHGHPPLDWHQTQTDLDSPIHLEHRLG